MSEATSSGPPTAPVRPKSIQYAAIAVGVVMLLLVALLITRKAIGDKSSASPVVGKPAPAVAGKALLGRPFDIGTNDRWLVVNFFATWCTPCVAEHPELRAFSDEHKTDGKARVVSVVYGDTAARVRSFFRQHKGSWTVLDSDDGRTALDWGVSKVPESFLVAPNGIVLNRFDTGDGVTKDELDSYIEAYEKQQASKDGGS
jgi:cytochrome c biogenesis protein CcmG/thiol:disulfide interchange protein DsbE